MDWRGFKALCLEEEAGQDRAALPSYANILVIEVLDAHVPTGYIEECLYCQNGKVTYYIRDTTAMHRALYGFCFIH